MTLVIEATEAGFSYMNLVISEICKLQKTTRFKVEKTIYYDKLKLYSKKTITDFKWNMFCKYALSYLFFLKNMVVAESTQDPYDKNSIAFYNSILSNSRCLNFTKYYPVEIDEKRRISHLIELFPLSGETPEKEYILQNARIPYFLKESMKKIQTVRKKTSIQTSVQETSVRRQEYKEKQKNEPTRSFSKSTYRTAKASKKITTSSHKDVAFPKYVSNDAFLQNLNQSDTIESTVYEPFFSGKSSDPPLPRDKEPSDFDMNDKTLKIILNKWKNIVEKALNNKEPPKTVTFDDETNKANDDSPGVYNYAIDHADDIDIEYEEDAQSTSSEDDESSNHGKYDENITIKASTVNAVKLIDFTKKTTTLNTIGE